MNQGLRWTAAIVTLAWAVVRTAVYHTPFWLSILQLVFATLVLSLIMHLAYQLTGNKGPFLSTLCIAAICASFFLVEPFLRAPFLGAVTPYLFGRDYFVAQEIAIVLLQLALGSAAVLTFTLIIHRHDRQEQPRKRYAFMVSCVSALLVFELIIVGMQWRTGDSATELPLAATLGGQTLFTNDQIIDRCTFERCAGISSCEPLGDHYGCTFINEILLDPAVLDQYQRLRSTALADGTETGTLVVTSNGQELSRIVIQYGPTPQLARVLPITAYAEGQTRAIAEDNATAQGLALIGES